MIESQFSQSLKRDAFALRNAAKETEWFLSAFVPPQDYQAMITMSSIIVFGETGAGKTGLRLALMEEARRETPPILPVEWHLRPLPPTVQGSEVVEEFLSQMFQECAIALLKWLIAHPESFDSLNELDREMVWWFVHHHAVALSERSIKRLEIGISEGGHALLNHLLNSPPPGLFDKETRKQEIIRELIVTLEYLGFKGVWIVMDEFESWADNEPTEQAASLSTLLTNLALFENRFFALKLFIPHQLEAAILTNSAVADQRRIKIHRLRWSPRRLRQVVERRFAVATGRDHFTLADFCAFEGVLPWLEKYGGSLPHGWLDMLNPFAEAYLEQDACAPLSVERWHELEKRTPPQLRLDPNDDRVFLGYHEVPAIPPSLFKLLRYLYNERRWCSREELFYRVYRELSHQPRVTGDKDHEDIPTVNGLIDTMISRLRKHLEPTPRKPRYIETKRHYGIRLNHVI